MMFYTEFLDEIANVKEQVHPFKIFFRCLPDHFVIDLTYYGAALTKKIPYNTCHIDGMLVITVDKMVQELRTLK